MTISARLHSLSTPAMDFSHVVPPGYRYGDYYVLRQAPEQRILHLVVAVSAHLVKIDRYLDNARTGPMIVAGPAQRLARGPAFNVGLCASAGLPPMILP